LVGSAGLWCAKIGLTAGWRACERSARTYRMWWARLWVAKAGLAIIGFAHARYASPVRVAPILVGFHIRHKS